MKSISCSSIQISNPGEPPCRGCCVESRWVRADGEGWNTPTMHEMRLEGSKKGQERGLVNMTKGLLASSKREKENESEREANKVVWLDLNQEFDHHIQRWNLIFADLVKQDPGRARQNS